SVRLRHCESSVYACATISGLRVFHASCAALTLASAVSSVNGGRIGVLIGYAPDQTKKVQFGTTTLARYNCGAIGEVRRRLGRSTFFAVAVVRKAQAAG